MATKKTARKFEAYGTFWRNDDWVEISKAAFHQRLEGGEVAFWYLVEHYWGAKAPRKFIRNPWSDRMVWEACRGSYLGVSGCGRSSKTTTFAIWALISWLCAPETTKVLVTSTSKLESRNRIWGQIRDYYVGASVPLPGKLLDSFCKILLSSKDDPEAPSMSGIELIAADRTKEKEAVGKMIGIHNENVILVADELPELSPAILEAFYGNMTTNPRAQIVGLGNFASVYDPFGTFTAPVGGWGSLGQDADEWDTVCNGIKGKCIRFDGAKSPNVLAGEDIYPFLYRNKDYQLHLAGGEQSARFWRMCRSFPCPSGEEHVLFSEADLISGKVHEQAAWFGKPTRLAGCDPAWTKDGDDAVVVFGWYGQTTDGRSVIAFDKVEVLKEDMRLTSKSILRQRAEALVVACQREGVDVKNLGIEIGGGGIGFAELVGQLWTPTFHRVQFGGAASDLTVGEGTAKTGKEAYDNRVSELWGRGVEFVRAGQIKSLPLRVAQEWKERHYATVKKDGALKILVEPKKEMKKRLGHSPDTGDAAVVLLDVACDVLGARPAGLVDLDRDEPQEDWDKWAAKENVVYEKALSALVLT